MNPSRGCVLFSFCAKCLRFQERLDSQAVMKRRCTPPRDPMADKLLRDAQFSRQERGSPILGSGPGLEISEEFFFWIH
jgi:hypothetical protein